LAEWKSQECTGWTGRPGLDRDEILGLAEWGIVGEDLRVGRVGDSWVEI